MCGIVAYTGKQNAPNQILEGLAKLEYRGYDSAGMASIREGKLEIIKRKGKIVNLKEATKTIIKTTDITCGIGHTRWATHGKPSDDNSHPHTDCTGKLAIVHNGIIENYKKLREGLTIRGHKFRSETDTEVIAHLIEEELKEPTTELQSYLVSITRATKKLKGQYAIAIIHEDFPDVIVGIRYKAPLLVGVGQDEIIIASDLTAIIGNTPNLLELNDGEIVLITPNSYDVYNLDNIEVNHDLPLQEIFEKAKIERHPEVNNITIENTQKGKYEHFMLKEIYEQPKSILKTIETNSKNGEIELNIPKDLKFNQVIFTACGTASYSGLLGRAYFQHLFEMPVIWDIGSELRYSNTYIDENTLVVGISQSGETADTLEALRIAKKKNATTIVVTNWIGSTMAREADYVVNMNCGAEIGVAASKTYTSQLISVIMLGKYFTRDLETKTFEELSGHIEKVLKDAELFESWAKDFSHCTSMIYIGRGYNLATAYEGAIKNKEISYIHAEGYAAGELKHGPIALLDENTPVVAIATQDKWYEKTISNIEESLARKAPMILITNEGNNALDKMSKYVYKVPKANNALQTVLNIIPLQLFAYYLAKELGLEIDKPRNLAKSVTVE